MHIHFSTLQSPTRSTKSISRRGFTLIEVIVVIAIIATLLGVGVSTMKNMAASKGVGTGIAISENIFKLARDTAKSRGGARLLIYADTGGSKADTRERHLRYIAIAVPKLIDNNLPIAPANIEWKLTAKGITLPKSIYFNAKLSGLTASNKETALFPGSTSQRSCYYYEFNTEGALVSPTTGGRFIIQAGKLIPGKDTPIKMKNRKKDAAGFVIRRNGRMSLFRSPNQIKEVAGALDF